MQVLHNSVARSRNVYISLVILKAWNHFIRKQRFYRDFATPVTIASKVPHIFVRFSPNLDFLDTLL
jgi:hypothetical protein